MKLAICLLVLSFCTVTFSSQGQGKSKPAKTIKSKAVKKKKKARFQYGTASFYHSKFNGRQTANGDIFSQKKFTAAHNTLPLGTWIKVTNLRNRKTVIVKITDRLHHRNKRLLDLSTAAANKISFTKAGLLPIKVEILGKSTAFTTVN
jgi:rare lipoprotein A